MKPASGAPLSNRTMWTGSALAVVACALLSLFKGQDTNWDLQNYHRYVAYAVFEGRFWRDFAPAGLQSYFNPTMDLPIYWLTEHADARVTGALLGAWHGLVFVCCLALSRRLWPQGDARGHLWVAGAGVLAPAFWGGLGNTMGDNAAAVVALAALCAAVQGLSQLHAGAFRRAWPWWGLTGLLLGLCTSLKLTNATVAVAMGAALLLCLPRLTVLPGVLACLVPAGVLGFGLGGGWWFYEVWQRFGNPFFPQFSSLFPGPYAHSVALADTRFLAEGVGGLLVRPLLMPIHPQLSSEFLVLPLLWPVWWLIGAASLGMGLVKRRSPQVEASQQAVPGGVVLLVLQRFVLLFVLLAYLAWAKVFGIYRYAVSFEPLLPLCAVVMLSRMGWLQAGWPWLKRFFVVAMAVTVLGGSVDWGHTGWASRAFRTDAPVSLAGERPLVLVVDNGQSWLLPFLPARASFTILGGNFDFGPRFRDEVVRRARAADAVYALLPMARNGRYQTVDEANRWLGAAGLLSGDPPCRWIEEIVRKTRPHAGFARCEGAACAHRCMLTKLPADQARIDSRNERELAETASVLQARDRLVLDPQRCQVEGAFIGQQRYAFRLCRLTPLPDAASAPAGPQHRP